MDVNMVEIMLENEQKNSSDRLAYLEKHVQQQNDELLCLKSALADVIRRMQLLESAQFIQEQKQQLASHQQHRSPHKMLVPSSRPLHTKKQHLKDSLLNNSIIPDHNKENRAYNRSLNGSKANSVEKLAIAPKKVFQASVEFNQQPLSFNSDSGIVKFFLRGRPISVFLPKENQVSSNSNEIGFRFDTEKVIKAPKEHLKLEWVYGYRGKDSRSNLYQLPTGEIIYFIAATVILFNPDEHTQRHYTGHTDDVKVIDFYLPSFKSESDTKIST